MAAYAVAASGGAGVISMAQRRADIRSKLEAEERAAGRDVLFVDKDEGLVSDEHLREFFV